MSIKLINLNHLLTQFSHYGMTLIPNSLGEILHFPLRLNSNSIFSREPSQMPLLLGRNSSFYLPLIIDTTKFSYNWHQLVLLLNYLEIHPPLPPKDNLPEDITGVFVFSIFPFQRVKLRRKCHIKNHIFLSNVPSTSCVSELCQLPWLISFHGLV